jgi:hypothetical protein
VLASDSDTRIADFVNIGKAAADAADKQTELNAAEQARLIQARVEQIVAAGGYEVRSAGQMALDSEGPATIAAFWSPGAARMAGAGTSIIVVAVRPAVRMAPRRIRNRLLNLLTDTEKAPPVAKPASPAIGR